ncbi:YIP1 family protein [Methanofollis aquaemaris]|uniref:YIP1 family protein n=1 Tax=Methanofollis aquaemaris TaxID=126734 RepID=A0A8A3S3S0_9EURY|nr:Yip1 family protein [Methanofollis aquaemaris]QSZ66788.1 YIP1 family protein [Methanofollis aquaemaris]
MDTDTSFIDILTGPERFFESLGERIESIKIPGIIILFTALLAALTAYLAAGAVPLTGLEGADAEALRPFVGIFAAAAIFIGIFIIWGIQSLILHVIAKVLGGTGSFKSTLAVVGYGNLPQVLMGVLGLALLLVYHMDIEKLSAALGLVIMGLIFTLWSTVIWFFGFKHAHELTTAKAGVIAGIILIISMLSIAI